VIWYVIGMAPLVIVAVFTAVAYVRRPRDPGPVVLESGEPRERVRAVIERDTHG
jgi:hypothetical protein